MTCGFMQHRQWQKLTELNVWNLKLGVGPWDTLKLRLSSPKSNQIKSNQTFRDVLLPHDNFRNDFTNSQVKCGLIKKCFLSENVSKINEKSDS